MPTLPLRATTTLQAVAAFILSTRAAYADPSFTLTLRDHRFEPASLTVPAGTRVRLDIVNEDSSAEEFESHALNREKLIPAGGKASIYVGPLAPGRYGFFGEFHEATATGQLIAE